MRSCSPTFPHPYDIAFSPACWYPHRRKLHKGGLMQGKRTFFSKKRVVRWGSLWSLAVLPATVFAADELNPGDTAWVLISTALGLCMMIPGLAMFYAGLVRRRNVLSLCVQCFG